MPTDLHISVAAQAMLDSVAVPAVPFAAIRERVIARRESARWPGARLHRRRAIAAALAVAALPTAAFAIVSYEARSRVALQQQGGWAPPSAPAALMPELRPKVVTLAQAQSDAGFSLVEPTGLPAGTSLMRIELSPVGLYDRSSRTWRVGPREVVFRYERGNSRTFEIVAQRYDDRNVPGRYVFEDVGPDSNGNPVPHRYERFAWRSGNQMTVVTAGSAISEKEILELARSMSGTMLTLSWPSPHSHGTLRILAPK